jgi:hypothetical protein
MALSPSNWSDDRSWAAAATVSVKVFRSCRYGDHQPTSSCLITPEGRGGNPISLFCIERRCSDEPAEHPRAFQISIAQSLIVTWTSGVEHTIDLGKIIDRFVAFELGKASGLPVTHSKRTLGCDRHMARSTYALSQLDALTVCSHKPSPSKGRSSKAIALYLIPVDVFMQTGTNVRGLCLV